MHEAILDAITCGNTEINVQDVRLSLNKLAVVNQQQGKTGYQIEFEVKEYILLNNTEAIYLRRRCTTYK